eukprot:6190075-Ditylum_brightwellii.AAC.1
MEKWHLNGLAQLEEELKQSKQDQIKWMTQFNKEYKDLAADFTSDGDNLIEKEIIEKEPENHPRDIGSEILDLEVVTVNNLEDVIQ